MQLFDIFARAVMVCAITYGFAAIYWSARDAIPHIKRLMAEAKALEENDDEA
jgi:hypothetical protein